MTTSELIEKLKTLDPEGNSIVTCINGADETVDLTEIEPCLLVMDRESSIYWAAEPWERGIKALHLRS